MISQALAALESEEQKSELAEFYIENYKKLYVVAYSVLKNKHLSEDALEETFLRIVKNPEKFFPIDRNKRLPLCVIIIRNISIDIIRRNKKISEESLFDIYNKSPQHFSEDSISDYVEYNELLAFINKLPLLQKDVLTLSSIYGFSNAEIADILNISDNLVRQKLFLARKSVKKYLESRCENE